MKNYFLIVFSVFTLGTGIVSGIAYERYLHREECLKLAFDDSGVKTIPDDEIEEILKSLNDPTPEDESKNNAPQTENKNNVPPTENKNNGEANNKSFVGSKNSNKFYLTDCRYAKLIKEENKIYFSSKEEAEKNGRVYKECK